MVPRAVKIVLAPAQKHAQTVIHDFDGERCQFPSSKAAGNADQQ